MRNKFWKTIDTRHGQINLGDRVSWMFPIAFIFLCFLYCCGKISCVLILNWKGTGVGERASDVGFFFVYGLCQWRSAPPAPDSPQLPRSTLLPFDVPAVRKKALKKVRWNNPAVVPLGIYPNELGSYVHTKTCTRICVETLWIIVKSWKPPRCPSGREWVNNHERRGCSSCWKEVSGKALRRGGGILNTRF